MSNLNLFEPTNSASSASSNSNHSSSFISYLSSSFKRKNGSNTSPKLSSSSTDRTTKQSSAILRSPPFSSSQSSSCSSPSPGLCRRPNIKTKRPIKIENFDRYFEENKRDSNFGFSQEFDHLNQLCRETIYQQSQMRAIAGKNRYANIIPYEHSIVKLTQIGSDTSTTYINANYVAGHNYEDEYIASQAPLHSTLGDFYRMLIEQNVKIVVNLLEKENPPYFPSDVNNDSSNEDNNLNNNNSTNDNNSMECEIAMDKDFPELKSKIRLVLISDDDRQYYRIRTIDICAEGRPKHRVIQFHYRIWEDFGTPNNARTLIEFIRVVRRHVISLRSKTLTLSGRTSPSLSLSLSSSTSSSSSQSTSSSPIVVHCNAGVGRTGTFIAVDQLMQTLMPHEFDTHINMHSSGEKSNAGNEWSFKWKTMRLFIQNIASNNSDRSILNDWQSVSKVSVIDVFGLVYRLRNYRPFLVQTENQYAFIYDCVRLLLRDSGYIGTKKNKSNLLNSTGGDNLQ